MLDLITKLTNAMITEQVDREMVPTYEVKVSGNFAKVIYCHERITGVQLFIDLTTGEIYNAATISKPGKTVQAVLTEEYIPRLAQCFTASIFLKEIKKKGA